MLPIRLAVLFIEALSIIVIPHIALAGFYYYGYDLKEWADADDRTDLGNAQPTDYQKVGELRGYVVGVHDAMESSLICLPAGTKVVQLIGIVKQYVRANPDK